MRKNKARICIALIVATGCADAAAPLARSVAPATAQPVLLENFETPKTTDYTVLGASPLLQAEIRHQAPRQFKQNVAFNGTFVADGAKATLRFTSLNTGNAGVTVDGITIRPM